MQRDSGGKVNILALANVSDCEKESSCGHLSSFRVSIDIELFESTNTKVLGMAVNKNTFLTLTFRLIFM